MKTILRFSPSLLLAALLVGGLASCIMEEKVIELVLKGETSAEFAYNDTNELYEAVKEIELSEKIAELIDDAGLSRDEIKSAFVVGVEYEVTALTAPSGHDDWLISGRITIDSDHDDPNAGFVALVTYTEQSVAAAMGKRHSQTLQSEGVDMINGALESFLDGGSPTVSLAIENGDVEPSPSAGDPIVFTWQIWLTIQVTGEETLDVPDPF
jgi:hypothetical protein